MHSWFSLKLCQKRSYVTVEVKSLNMNYTDPSCWRGELHVLHRLQSDPPTINKQFNILTIKFDNFPTSGKQTKDAGSSTELVWTRKTRRLRVKWTFSVSVTSHQERWNEDRRKVAEEKDSLINFTINFSSLVATRTFGWIWEEWSWACLGLWLVEDHWACLFVK